MERYINDNIILIGMSGVGKTTIGLELSKKIHYGFIDMDIYIESKMKKSIEDIFEEDGEAYFRELESETLNHLRNKKNTVISTGGGIVTSNNVAILKELGQVIYLRANLDTLYKHILEDKINIRPLLKVDNIEKNLRDIHNMRCDDYELISDYIVDVDGLPKEKIISNILKVI